jgi:hypothetical protein
VIIEIFPSRKWQLSFQENYKFLWHFPDKEMSLKLSLKLEIFCSTHYSYCQFLEKKVINIHIHISLAQKLQWNLLNPKNFWSKVYRFVDIFLYRKTQKNTKFFGFLCHKNDKKFQREFIVFASLKSWNFQIFLRFLRARIYIKIFSFLLMFWAENISGILK